MYYINKEVGFLIISQEIYFIGLYGYGSYIKKNVCCFVMFIICVLNNLYIYVYVDFNKVRIYMYVLQIFYIVMGFQKNL